MPDEPVVQSDTDLLQCGCKKEEALLEEVFVQLGFIEKEVAEDRKALGEKSGWKALGRPERERTLKLLDRFGLGIDDLLELIQD